MAKTNNLDQILSEKCGVTQSSLVSFKNDLAKKTRKLFPTRRGACKFHEQELSAKFPNLKGLFPYRVNARVEKHNSDGSKFYDYKWTEVTYDRAVQQWSTTICKMANSEKHSQKIHSSKKVDTDTKVDKFIDTIENQFNIDLDYTPNIEHDTVISYARDGAKIVETPSGYKIHF